MKSRILLIVWAAIGGVLAILAISHRAPAPETMARRAAPQPAPVVIPEPPRESPAVPENPTPAIPPLEEAAPPPAPPKAESVPNIKPQRPPARPQQAQTQPRQKPELIDPTARVALSWVGADSEAEEYWIAAINDPDIPAKEREDLIEDLNEEGLPDPKHPTLDDLPLILYRLALIEELAPYSMDEVNARSFAEAYKDLKNLAKLALGRGEPVK
jgi:hypothetical protein